ncbi:general substrate transporter [Pterulicium gracile]|uniref:General substrate transporter n=1 Tax=Pterulicium gracile TaxID=1884261 RepID=A0A5C3QEG7_9AGAR|nr:general substrate transporter [Pterula gracilis]
MGGGAALAGGQTDLLHRRQALAGKSGWAGLVANLRVFLIAVFASLGGLLYGYNQGVFSGVLPMNNFIKEIGDDAIDSGKKGWLVAILELGAWIGVLCTGYLADRFSRKYTIIIAVVVFCVGVVVQTAAKAAPSIYGGRFVTGLGVGSLSMVVPLYNAEMAPPEVRGSLVGLQQLAITFGIMVSFWIDYGTNHIGGTGDTQTQAAWRIPLALQLFPALILGLGALFIPFSPRWLVKQGREEEALAVLSRARPHAPPDLVRLEFLEIKAQHEFEEEVSREMFPQYQDGTFASNFKLGFHEYLSLFKKRTLLRRVAIGTLIMFFQQWTGVNAVLYYAPSIFNQLGLTGSTNSLLATGVVGVAMFLATIPAVIWIDQLGRKPVLISGAFIMAGCHFIVALLAGLYQDDWESHAAAGWVAVVFVWIFAVGFGYSWGPCAWIVIAEIWPLSIRGKGLSIAASSNWMNNFIVGQVTPTMLEHLTYGTNIFFGAFSLLGGLFVWFLMPETKLLTLEEMDEVFGDAEGLGVADLARQRAIHERLGLIDAGNISKSSDEKIRDEKEHIASPAAV